MKRILIPVLILAVAVSAFPQNKKGNLLIGTSIGSAGLSFGSSESGSSSSTNRSESESSGYSFGIGPTIGYFFTDKFVAGAYLGVGFNSNRSSNTQTESDYESKSNSHSVYLSLGPFVRYYLGAPNAKRMPYIHAYISTSLYPSYGGHYETNSGYEYDYGYESYSYWGGGVQLGYEHFVNSAIGLQYYVGYSFSRYSYEYKYEYPDRDDQLSEYKSTSNGLTVGVGIQIHLDWLNRNR
ncbi:MAG: outer membrane beta-barrel protein [Candidatus Aminicenantes bacterium]|nr:outer membrane beta-barrel protein [Candidatus Aminicenantes bacterium]